MVYQKLMQLHNKISIILVRPQLGENIGMAARAMLNFGFDDLRIVSPRDGWPNPKAISSAAHASKVIEKAKVFNSLAEAAADSHFTFATSARSRSINLPFISSREVINQKIKGNNISIIFGPENSGLSNNDLNSCNSIISIPVNEDCPSINLASSVALLCYEFSNLSEIESKDNNIDLATNRDVENLIKILFALLEEKNHFELVEKKNVMQNNLRSIFNKVQHFSQQEARSLIGVFKALARDKK